MCQCRNRYCWDHEDDEDLPSYLTCCIDGGKTEEIKGKMEPADPMESSMNWYCRDPKNLEESPKPENGGIPSGKAYNPFGKKPIVKN